VATTPDSYPQPRTSDVESLLRASRVVTAVVTSSLLEAGEGSLTLPQLRGLVLVASGRATSTTELAAALEVHASSASRLVDRLVAAGLVRRAPSPRDRRQVVLATTAAGRRTLDAVMEHRRQRFRALLARLDEPTRRSLSAALDALSDAAGEPEGVPHLP
jgi:DNA-binding MarR family transcriptional regulator